MKLDSLMVSRPSGSWKGSAGAGKDRAIYPSEVSHSETLIQIEINFIIRRERD